jgi:hypothetical protein
LTVTTIGEPLRATLTVSHHAKREDTATSPSRHLLETHNDLGEFPLSFSLSRAPPR